MRDGGTVFSPTDIRAMRCLRRSLTAVFVVKLLYAVCISSQSPDDYQACADIDEMYRLVHRGYCYYVAANNISMKQENAKAGMCGSNGRLAFPNEPTIVDFIRNRLGTFYQLTSAVKAWIGLEQMLDQDEPDAGWYYQGLDGEIATIDPALFFYDRTSSGTCAYSVPTGCMAEFEYRGNTYQGCIRVDDAHCWCATDAQYDLYGYLYCGQHEEIVLGSDCLSGGACGNEADCTYDYYMQPQYNCNCPAAGGDETQNGCFAAKHGVSDGKNATERNKYQLAIITQAGNILEAAEVHQYNYAVCQYKERGTLLQNKREGLKIRNGISASINGVKTAAKCARKCDQSWTCAAISYSVTQNLCLLHSIPASHTKAIVVEDEEFSTWDHAV